MKISAQDEYGLRVLLRIARSDQDEGLSIPQLSELEGLSASYTAKLTRTLRLGGLIESTPGQRGGYVLARPAEEIVIRDVLKALGGLLFDGSFCQSHSGNLRLCTNSVDCSVRSLWRMVQVAVDQVLEKVTLKDLMSSEKDARQRLDEVVAPFIAVGA